MTIFITTFDSWLLILDALRLDLLPRRLFSSILSLKPIRPSVMRPLSCRSYRNSRGGAYRQPLNNVAPHESFYGLLLNVVGRLKFRQLLLSLVQLFLSRFSTRQASPLRFTVIIHSHLIYQLHQTMACKHLPPHLRLDGPLVLARTLLRRRRSFRCVSVCLARDLRIPCKRLVLPELGSEGCLFL
jgi:hypothetical protein